MLYDQELSAFYKLNELFYDELLYPIIQTVSLFWAYSVYSLVFWPESLHMPGSSQ